MKPETKRIAIARRRSDEDGVSSPFNLTSLKQAIDGCSSPFNLTSLKQAIETIDTTKETTTSDLSSLSSAFSSEIRKMKLTEKSERKRAREFKRKRKFVIGVKPDTNAELRRWFSNFNESLKETLIKRKNDKQAYKVPPKTTFKEPQICEFNTDFTKLHFS